MVDFSGSDTSPLSGQARARATQRLPDCQRYSPPSVQQSVPDSVSAKCEEQDYKSCPEMENSALVLPKSWT